ncbi:MAG: glycosyltransferase family 4 protein [Ktedonobacterales bacterium]
MRIAQVVPLHVAVPPLGYGGTERVVYELTEALVHMGHEVTLFASGDSRTSARLIPMVDRAINFDPNIDAAGYHAAMLDEVYDRASQFDIIHSHLDYLTLPFARHASTPTVLTLHDQLARPEAGRLYQRYRTANYVSISDSQRRDFPGLNYVATVHNAVDVDRFPFVAEPGKYLVFVGRMSPQKRPDVAIEIAKRTGIPLKIAAKVDHREELYFKETIEPLLDHPLIEWLGQVGEQEKRQLMAKALALVLPIEWPEPFGMVFIEALACGTPVLTCPRGAAPELLKDGVTGYCSMDLDALVAATRKIHRISRRGCRAYAQQRFNTQLMAAKYVRVYDQCMGRDYWPMPAMPDVAMLDTDSYSINMTTG